MQVLDVEDEWSLKMEGEWSEGEEEWRNNRVEVAAGKGFLEEICKGVTLSN